MATQTEMIMSILGLGKSIADSANAFAQQKKDALEAQRQKIIDEQNAKLKQQEFDANQLNIDRAKQEQADTIQARSLNEGLFAKNKADIEQQGKAIQLGQASPARQIGLGAPIGTPSPLGEGFTPTAQQGGVIQQAEIMTPEKKQGLQNVDMAQRAHDRMKALMLQGQKVDTTQLATPESIKADQEAQQAEAQQKFSDRLMKNKMTEAELEKTQAGTQKTLSDIDIDKKKLGLDYAKFGFDKEKFAKEQQQLLKEELKKIPENEFKALPKESQLQVEGFAKNLVQTKTYRTNLTEQNNVIKTALKNKNPSLAISTAEGMLKDINSRINADAIQGTDYSRLAQELQAYNANPLKFRMQIGADLPAFVEKVQTQIDASLGRERFFQKEIDSLYGRRSKDVEDVANKVFGGQSKVDKPQQAQSKVRAEDFINSIGAKR